MSKFMSDRWVCAPQYLSAGTCSGPNVSFSDRYFCSADMIDEEVSVRVTVTVDKRDRLEACYESTRRGVLTDERVRMAVR